MKNTYLILIVSLLFSFNLSSMTCKGAATRATKTANSVNIHNVATLKIGSFNTFNLFRHVGKWVKNSSTQKWQWSKIKSKSTEDRIKGIAESILEIDYDILALQEVESKNAAVNFNARYLSNKYRIYYSKGNDQRIHIVFFVKKELKLRYKLEPHAHITWRPSNHRSEQPLFSRDLPVLKIFPQKDVHKRGPPLFIMAGVHFKSKRDRNGDPESVKKRSAEAQKTVEILEDYAKTYPKTPVFVMGDFNADLRFDPSTKPLRQSFLVNPFLTNKIKSDLDLATHSFFGGGTAKYGFIDGVLVGAKYKDFVLTSHIYRYKDKNGTPKAIPQNYKERELNPSDHYPVYIVFQNPYYKKE